MFTRERFAGPRLLLSAVLVSGLFSTCTAQDPSGGSPPSTTGWKIKFDGSGPSPVMTNGVLYMGSAVMTGCR